MFWHFSLLFSLSVKALVVMWAVWAMNTCNCTQLVKCPSCFLFCPSSTASGTNTLSAAELVSGNIFRIYCLETFHDEYSTQRYLGSKIHDDSVSSEGFIFQFVSMQVGSLSLETQSTIKSSISKHSGFYASVDVLWGRDTRTCFATSRLIMSSK